MKNAHDSKLPMHAILVLVILGFWNVTGQTSESLGSLEGAWVSDGDVVSQTLTFENNKNKAGWTGTATSRFGIIRLTDIVYNGNNVSFSEEYSGGLNDFPPVRVLGVLDGDKLSLKLDAFRYGYIDRVAHRARGKEAIGQRANPGTMQPLKPLADNRLARRPPMGWNSWNHFELRIDDKTVREVADALVSTGLRDAGYMYVNIDDGWQGSRDSKGELRGNERFPDMRKLADYVHSRGLKLGIYSSPGPRTCGGFEGSFGHEEQDARTYADWGIDYLKYDWCSARTVYSTPGEMQAAYLKMGAALQGGKRPIVYSLCQYGMFDVGRWGRKVGGNLWRTTSDISDYWSRMEGIGFGQNGRENDAGPGGWNDPDMLEVGNGGMTLDEYRTHITLWSLLSAPLLLGNDVRALSQETRSLLTNREVIAVDQDPLGFQGHRISASGRTEIWAKPLFDGSLAVAIFNRDDAPAEVQLKWASVRAAGITKVRDLWAQNDLPLPSDGYHAFLRPHGTVLMRVQ